MQSQCISAGPPYMYNNFFVHTCKWKASGLYSQFTQNFTGNANAKQCLVRLLLC